MAAFMWITLLFAAAACNGESPRIVGGNPTTIEKYPGIVQVENLLFGTWTQACGANILTSRWLVSAAHCFDEFLYTVNNRRIRAGTTYRESGGTILPVLRALIHPTWLTLGLEGDISLVQLESPLTYGVGIQSVAIPPQNFEFPAGLPVYHAGWGSIYEGGPPSDVLRDVEIYTINRELCAARYASLPIPQLVTEKMICAGLLDVGGRDACQRDSGGPLYYTDILIGIVSWGHGCANETFPGISVNVASYTDWIVSNAV